MSFISRIDKPAIPPRKPFDDIARTLRIVLGYIAVMAISIAAIVTVCFGAPIAVAMKFAGVMTAFMLVIIFLICIGIIALWAISAVVWHYFIKRFG